MTPYLNNLYSKKISVTEIVERIAERKDLYWRDFTIVRRKKVYIYEYLISKYLDNILEIFLESKTESYLVYREIVRLHEHIHAYIHKKVGGFWNYTKNVNEPVTEFLCYCVIKNYLSKDRCYGKKILKLFKDLPRRSPYKEWVDILSFEVEITPKNRVKLVDLCDILEKDDTLLRILFRILVDILRTNPQKLDDIKGRLMTYYPKSAIVWSLERI